MRINWPLNKSFQDFPILGLHLLFLPLFILACIYFQERLFADSGTALFEVINSESFFFRHDRFIFFFSQFIPLLAVKLGLGVKSIVVLYSLGHILFFFSIFLIILYVFKDKYGAFAIILIQYLGITNSFYSLPNSEIQYVTVLLVLFHSMILNWQSYDLKFILLSAILIFFIITGYPIGIYLLVFLLIEDRQYLKGKWVGIIMILITCFAFDVLTFDSNEKFVMVRGFGRSFQNLKDIFLDPEMVIYTPILLITRAPDLFLLFIIILFHNIFKRDKIAILTQSGPVVLYILMLIVTYGKYIFLDSYLIALAILVTIPYLYDILPNARGLRKTAAIAVLALILTGKFALILSQSSFFEERVDTIQWLTQNCGSSQSSFFMIEDENLLQGNPFAQPNTFLKESLLISTVLDKNNSIGIFWRNIIVEHDSVYFSGKEDLSDLDSLVTDMKLNTSFFKVTPGPSSYCEVSKK